VSLLSADELLTYFDQVSEAMSSYLSQLSSEVLYHPPGRPSEPQTVYAWLRDLLADSQEHLGEIKAITAMRERRFPAA
jgi:hypothetical protein